jgi:FtsH-binding integral membrane protein
MKKFITKYLMAIIVLIVIVLANIWCLSENDRLLKPITNLVFVFFVILNVFKANRNEK